MSRKFFDIEQPGRRAASTPPPVPDFLRPKDGDAPKTLKLKRRLRFGFYFFVLLLGTGFVALIARASFVKYFPAECSGNWQNAEAIQVPIPENGFNEVITDKNSAILNGPAGSEIICSKFSAGEKPGKMLEAKLNLIWAFRNKNTEVLPLPAVAESATTTTTSTPESIPAVISDSTSTASSSAVSAPAVLEEPKPVEDVKPVVVEPTPAVPPPVEKPAEPAPAPTAPAVTPVDTPPAPTSFFRNFISTANAQTSDAPVVTASLAFNGLEHFLDIQYSLDDGANWKSIDNADLILPLAGFEDISNVKIKVISLREGEDIPNVYLRAMYLEAKYIPEVQDTAITEATSTENNASTTVEQVVEDTSSTSILDSLTDAASNAVQAIADVLTGDNQSEAPQIAAKSAAPGEAAYVPPKPPEFLFARGAEAPKSGQASILDAFGLGGNNSQKPAEPQKFKVAFSGDNKSILIDGVCSAKYYSIMLFTNKEDFEKDPAKAVINRAVLCENGKYSFSLDSKNLPLSMTDGNYYLILGDQGEGETPKPADVPVELNIKKINQ